MNNSELQPCPLCEATLDLYGPIYSNKKDLLNNVYICARCGLVHKPILNFSDAINSDSVYSVSSWKTGNEVHLQRMRNVVDLVEQRLLFGSDSSILDVGAGIGLLFDVISSKKTVTKYVALEPVTAIAAKLKQNHPQIIVLNSAIDRADIPVDLFDLVFVLGVDYLFENIDSAFKNIQNCLKRDGHVVIQRNVFIDQTAYVGKKIGSLEDMFGSNLLIRNWFHSGQYHEFLNKYFVVDDIVREEFEFTGKLGRSYKMFQLTYFCQSRNVDSKVEKQQIHSYFDTNKAIIDGLS